MPAVRQGIIEGPDLAPIIKQLLELATMDKELKEPIRVRLKAWQAGVIAKMKEAAPDDPETGKSRIAAALRAKAPVISRTRGRIIASFVTDAARLGASAEGKKTGVGRGIAWSLAQHEDLTLSHRHGGAKYMERPFTAAAPAAAEVMEAALAEITSKLARG